MRKVRGSVANDKLSGNGRCVSAYTLKLTVVGPPRRWLGRTGHVRELSGGRIRTTAQAMKNHQSLGQTRALMHSVAEARGRFRVPAKGRNTSRVVHSQDYNESSAEAWGAHTIALYR